MPGSHVAQGELHEAGKRRSRQEETFQNWLFHISLHLDEHQNDQRPLVLPTVISHTGPAAKILLPDSLASNTLSR